MRIIFPKHIAIIMDGNGRWATKRNLPRIAGHKAGLEVIKEIVAYCAKQPVEVLTLWAFSTENWGRPKTEVNYLMRLFLHSIKNVSAELNKNNIQFRVIGDVSQLNASLQKIIAKTEANTKDNSGLKLVIAFNYGGKWDITQAVKKLVLRLENRILNVADITADMIERELATKELPDPDLLIRTSGELRLSNFLIWQLAYSELYFSKVLWPDFSVSELEKILKDYAGRERRYGLI